MDTITVRYLAGDRFAIQARNHAVTVDQPVPDGGEDTALTPTELFVGSLTACVGHYARRFLARHDLPTGGLTVGARYTIAAHPARVDTIHIEIELPQGVPADRRRALLAVASHCTVHNSFGASPQVTIELSERPCVAA